MSDQYAALAERIVMVVRRSRVSSTPSLVDVIAAELAPLLERVAQLEGLLRECREYALDWQVHCASTSEASDDAIVLERCQTEITDAKELLARIDAAVVAISGQKPT